MKPSVISTGAWRRLLRSSQKAISSIAKGSPSGRRAEVSLKPNRSSYAVMWTHGAMFREILADDVAHAIALENQYGD